jgi:hypothetical protein
MKFSQTAKREALRLERLYDTKGNGIKWMHLLRLVSTRGLDGAIEELESRGLKPKVPDE